MPFLSNEAGSISSLKVIRTTVSTGTSTLVSPGATASTVGGDSSRTMIPRSNTSPSVCNDALARAMPSKSTPSASNWKAPTGTPSNRKLPSAATASDFAPRAPLGALKNNPASTPSAGVVPSARNRIPTTEPLDPSTRSTRSLSPSASRLPASLAARGPSEAIT